MRLTPHQQEVLRPVVQAAVARLSHAEGGDDQEVHAVVGEVMVGVREALDTLRMAPLKRSELERRLESGFLDLASGLEIAGTRDAIFALLQSGRNTSVPAETADQSAIEEESEPMSFLHFCRGLNDEFLAGLDWLEEQEGDAAVEAQWGGKNSMLAFVAWLRAEVHSIPTSVPQEYEPLWNTALGALPGRREWGIVGHTFRRERLDTISSEDGARAFIGRSIPDPVSSHGYAVSFLSYFPQFSGEEWQAFCGAMAKMTDVDAGGSPILQVPVHQMQQLASSLPHLRRLSLSDTGLARRRNREKLDALLGAFGNLESVDLSDNDLEQLPEAVLRRLIDSMPCLRSLNIGGLDLRELQGKRLDDLTVNWPRLTALNLQNTSLHGLCVEDLAFLRVRSSGVRSLSVSDNQLQEMDAEQIRTFFDERTELRSLDLYRNAILNLLDESALTVLINSWKTVTDLNLIDCGAGSNISASRKSALFEGMRHVTSVKFAGDFTRNVSDAEVEIWAECLSRVRLPTGDQRLDAAILRRRQA